MHRPAKDTDRARYIAAVRSALSTGEWATTQVLLERVAAAFLPSVLASIENELAALDSTAFSHLFAWIGRRQHDQWVDTGDADRAARIDYYGGWGDLAIEVGLSGASSGRSVGSNVTEALKRAAEIGNVLGWGEGEHKALGLWGVESWPGAGRRSGRLRFIVGPALRIDWELENDLLVAQGKRRRKRQKAGKNSARKRARGRKGR